MNTNPQDKTSHKISGPRLTEGQRRAIVAAVSTGQRQVDVAKQFNVHPNTVYALWKSVRQTENSVASADWRRKLQEQLPVKAVDAIERSLDDVQDVHKAANTATTVLKGLGHLQGDSVNVNINQLFASIPDDMRERYIGSSEVEPST